MIRFQKRVFVPALLLWHNGQGGHECCGGCGAYTAFSIFFFKEGHFINTFLLSRLATGGTVVVAMLLLGTGWFILNVSFTGVMPAEVFSVVTLFRFIGLLCWLCVGAIAMMFTREHALRKSLELTKKKLDRERVFAVVTMGRKRSGRDGGG